MQEDMSQHYSCDDRRVNIDKNTNIPKGVKTITCKYAGDVSIEGLDYLKNIYAQQAK